MVDEQQNLQGRITEYNERLLSLDQTRQGLEREIEEIVRTQIIPEVVPLLPPRYSIDTERSEVSYNTEDVLPRGFVVTLRLLYNGKPIHSLASQSQMSNDVDGVLKHKLEDIAQRHNLAYILSSGEGVEVYQQS